MAAATIHPLLLNVCAAASHGEGEPEILVCDRPDKPDPYYLASYNVVVYLSDYEYADRYGREGVNGEPEPIDMLD